MDAADNEHERREATPTKHETTVERTSERELVVRRTVNGPARLVFEAWTRPELFEQWWVPKGAPLTLLSCTIDARVGGAYRLVFGLQGQEMAFHGTYREVVPGARLVWTNDEAGEAGQVSTATFEEQADGRTLVVLHERYPSKEALDEAIASGSQDGTVAQFEQLDAFVAELNARR